jgi:FKBP-type peptidyl-prolyl cis-trans isomerase
MTAKGLDTMGNAFLFAAMLAASGIARAQTPPTTPQAIPPPSDVAAPPADATKTASGLVTKVLSPGSGTDHPTPSDLVTIHYTGWTTDGKMFDSSVSRGKPSSFPVNRVIAGFSEGLQLMVMGEKRRVWIPESLAYKGQEGKPKGTLVFDIELIGIPTHAPSDVKAPPEDAKKLPSGLAYRVLKEGVGGRHPRSSSTVTVNYTGWTTDGKMFDSSYRQPNGGPSILPLDGVVRGWAEGLQLMVEGEKVRLWIPEKLAYEGKQAPFGMLVFDVELLRIQ